MGAHDSILTPPHIKIIGFLFTLSGIATFWMHPLMKALSWSGW